MTLGERIIKLRASKGISQSDLAEAMDVSRQSVSKWETGASVPDLDKLVKLSDYFNISLDQLVKGNEENLGQNVSENKPFTEKDKMSKTQTLGIFFLSMGVLAAILFASVFGLGFWGFFFAIPFLLFGAVCLLCKKHPVLKAVWADYIAVSLYLHISTSINPSRILYTFKWTYEMNYAILVFSWIWFIAVVLLIASTAFIFRNRGWAWDSKHKGQLILGAVLFIIGNVSGLFTLVFKNLIELFYLLQFYFQLAGLTILAVDITAWAVSRRKSNKAKA